MNHSRPPWFCAAALLLASTHAAVAAAPTPLADVPLISSAGQQPVVQVTLPKHAAVPCYVDTGSSITVLPGSLLADAVEVGRMSVTFYDRTERLVAYRVPHLAIGQARIEHVAAVRRDTWLDAPTAAMPCVLGASAWGNFSVDLDGPARRLRLFARGTRLAAILDGQAGGVALESYRSGALRTTAWIGDVRAETVLDTGWYRTTANAELLEALHVAANDPRLSTEQVGSLGGKTETISVFGVPSLRLGTLVLNDVGIEVSQRKYPLLRRQPRPYLHLGSDVIDRARLLVDLAHREAILAPAAPR